jgi:hypothetical protein
MQARLTFFVLLGCCASLVAQTPVTFDHQTYVAPTNSNNRVSVDLNNDRASDIITDGPNPSIYVLLSNGDGSFQAAREYPIGYTVRDIAAGDIDGDGNADVIVAAFDNVHGAFKGIGVLYGRGDGTLSPPVFYASTDIIPDRVAVADFTGDGRKDILITGGFSGDGNYYARLFTNSGGRNLSYGGGIQVSNDDSCCDYTAVQVGDFDGDGHADFFVQRNVQARGPNTTITLYTIYGDGHGHFVSGAAQSFNGNLSLVSIDLNQDAKSDIAGVLSVSDPDFNYTSKLISFYGNSGRTLIQTNLLTFSGSTAGMEAADFNGDGTLDLAFLGNDGTSSGTWLALQTAGVFTLQKTAYSVAPNLLGDFNRDNKPDLAQLLFNSSLEVLQNTTNGGFSNYCPIPSTGIAVCLPVASPNLTSPVAFEVSASAFNPLRKVEVWIDGQKKQESFYSYFDYAFLNGSYSLSAGTHRADIYSAGYDNTLQHKVFSFSVDSACPAATSPGLNVCSPVNGSTVSSPVRALATGKVTGTTARMEVWVDGIKKFTVTHSNTLDTSISLSKGNHRFDFYIVNTVNQKWEKTVYATVQ